MKQAFCQLSHRAFPHTGNRLTKNADLFSISVSVEELFGGHKSLGLASREVQRESELRETLVSVFTTDRFARVSVVLNKMLELKH